VKGCGDTCHNIAPVLKIDRVKEPYGIDRRELTHRPLVPRIKVSDMVREESRADRVDVYATKIAAAFQEEWPPLRHKALGTGELDALHRALDGAEIRLIVLTAVSSGIIVYLASRPVRSTPSLSLMPVRR